MDNGIAQWRVIDGDGHVMEDPTAIADFLPAPYAGLRTAFSIFPSFDGRVRKRYGAKPTTAELWGGFMDDLGMQQAVVYPTLGLAMGLVQDREWACALAQGYNAWLCETHLKPEPRLKGMALLPVQDPAEAARTLERGVSEMGLVGGLLPSVTYFKRPLGDEAFWPIYQMAERLDVPLAIHGGPQTGLGLEGLDRFVEAHTLEHPFPLILQFVNMVFSGVFHHFPRLRVVYLEAGAGWVPFLMDRMDYEAEAFKGQWTYPERPSDVIRRGNIYVTFQPGERMLPVVCDLFGTSQIFYASDFPHELSYEDYVEDLRAFTARDDLSEQARRQILAENSERFYGLGTPAAVGSAPR